MRRTDAIPGAIVVRKSDGVVCSVDPNTDFMHAYRGAIRFLLPLAFHPPTHHPSPLPPPFLPFSFPLLSLSSFLYLTSHTLWLSLGLVSLFSTLFFSPLPFELFMSMQEFGKARDLLIEIYSHQSQETGTWPQWFMFDPYANVQQAGSHCCMVCVPSKAFDG